MKCALSPPSLPLFGHLFAFKRDPLGFLTHCARNYGSVVPLRLLHIPAFLLLKPADIERVLVTEHRDFLKPAWLRTPAVRRLLGDGLVISDGEAWRRQRDTCRPAFQPRRMEAYGRTISGLAERMLQRWKPGQTLRLQQEMMYLTLEVVGCTLLTVDEPGWTVEAGTALDTLMARFSSGSGLFGMAPWPPGAEERQATRTLNRVIDFLIRQHEDARCPCSGREGKPAQGDDLLSLLREPKADGREVTSERSVREQVKTFLGAGYESSALTLTWAFLLLARHPDVACTLAAELHDVLRGRPPVPADMPHLPYTQAVIQETLRLYPPLWMTGRQSARACEIGGVRIPAGALVMTSQWAVQRLPRFFPEPDDFRPERWRNGETSGLPRFACFPFGGGPRICIAQQFAQLETTVILAAVAQRFRLELSPDTDISPWVSMTLRPPASLQVQLVAR